MTTNDPVAPECASCAAVWDKKGATHCWSADPSSAPPPPGACPTRAHADAVADTLPRYLDASEEARIARVAAQVDLWIPGCPPHPVTILDGFLRLLGRLEGDDLRLEGTGVLAPRGAPDGEGG